MLRYLNYFAMTDLLTRYGFKSAGSCQCGGAYTQKYKRDIYIIRIRPRRNKFAVFVMGGRLLDWTDLKELETKLNEYFPRDTVAAEKEA